MTIVVTGSDETNILIGSMAKKLGCKRSIAIVRNPEYANQLEFVKDVYDIDYIINPELSTANEIFVILWKTTPFILVIMQREKSL